MCQKSKSLTYLFFIAVTSSLDKTRMAIHHPGIKDLIQLGVMVNALNIITVVQ